jgi:hypothetical protein
MTDNETTRLKAEAQRQEAVFVIGVIGIVDQAALSSRKMDHASSNESSRCRRADRYAGSLSPAHGSRKD